MEPAFLDNKYQKWYFNLVNKARSEDRKKSSGEYYERHHIIPSCLGGSNSIKNLVLLTAKEHFIAHALLCKCTEGTAKLKMFYAFRMFQSASDTQHRYMSSALYERLRKETSIARSKSFSGTNCPMYEMKGSKHPTFGQKWYNDGTYEYKVFPDKVMPTWSLGRLHPTTQNIANYNKKRVKTNG